jgi:hypothetical protein
MSTEVFTSEGYNQTQTHPTEIMDAMNFIFYGTLKPFEMRTNEI